MQLCWFYKKETTFYNIPISSSVTNFVVPFTKQMAQDFACYIVTPPEMLKMLCPNIFFPLSVAKILELVTRKNIFLRKKNCPKSAWRHKSRSLCPYSTKIETGTFCLRVLIGLSVYSLRTFLGRFGLACVAGVQRRFLPEFSSSSPTPFPFYAKYFWPMGESDSIKWSMEYTRIYWHVFLHVKFRNQYNLKHI